MRDNMKKSFIYIALVAGVLLTPSFVYAETPLQAKSFFPFFSSEKNDTTESSTKTSPINETIFDLTELKEQPLFIRRQLVASHLDTILLRLNVLYDKTRMATNRLTENNIDTSTSETALLTAVNALTAAKTTIDTLMLSANDPLNETVVDLMIGEQTFKAVVIATEENLRIARENIILALTGLREAVQNSITPLSN